MTTAAASLTLAEAARIIDQAIRDRSYQRDTRLGDAVASYLAWKKLRASARTLEIYEGYLARLCIHAAANGDPTVDQISAQLLLDALSEHDRGSARLVRTAYNDFFKWAGNWGHRSSRNPVDLLPTIPEPPARVYDIFTVAEQARLAAATDRMPLPWIQRLRVRCVIDLGARSAELRGLQPIHFDLTERVVVVYGKGGKERLVPFGDHLFKAFVAYRNRPIPAVEHLDGGLRSLRPRTPAGTDYLFFPFSISSAGAVRWTRPANRLSDRSIRYWWERLIGEAGVRYRSLHMARHGVGTDLATGGADAFTIRDWLGHADVSTTQVYVHNSRTRLKKGQELLDAYRKAAGR